MSVKVGRSCPDCGKPMVFCGRGVWVCNRCGRGIVEGRYA